MKLAQIITFVLALCAAIADQAGLLRELVSTTAVLWMLVVTNVLSAALPSVLPDSAKTAAKTLPGALLLLVLPGCAELQSAKEPAQEVWYAAELLCRQDLTQYAQVQAVPGATKLIGEVCASVEAARPYVDVLLREKDARVADPLAWPRANARMLLARRVGQ